MLDGFYSAFIVDAKQAFDEFSWDLFNYMAHENVPGSNVNATRAHTNVPSNNGMLPLNWRADLMQWRSTISMRLSDPVYAWASETTVQFWYNNRPIRTTPLLDLILSPQMLGDWPENLLTSRRFPMLGSIDYEVIVQSTKEATEKLKTWLVENTNESKFTCWIWLEGEITRVIV